MFLLIMDNYSSFVEPSCIRKLYVPSAFSGTSTYILSLDERITDNEAPVFEHCNKYHGTSVDNITGTLVFGKNNEYLCLIDENNMKCARWGIDGKLQYYGFVENETATVKYYDDKERVECLFELNGKDLTATYYTSLPMNDIDEKNISYYFGKFDLGRSLSNCPQVIAKINKINEIKECEEDMSYHIEDKLSLEKDIESNKDDFLTKQILRYVCKSKPRSYKENCKAIKNAFDEELDIHLQLGGEMPDERIEYLKNLIQDMKDLDIYMENKQWTIDDNQEYISLVEEKVKEELRCLECESDSVVVSEDIALENSKTELDRIFGPGFSARFDAAFKSGLFFKTQ